MEKSAVAKYVWENHHPIDWEETTVLDHGRGQELLVKEALHIQRTPSEEHFNRDATSICTVYLVSIYCCVLEKCNQQYGIYINFPQK